MRRKQCLAVLLAVTMAGSMMPTTVRAAEAENLTAEQKDETEENKEPDEKDEELKEQTEESEEQKASTEAKQDSEKEETSEEITEESKEEAKEEGSGETSKEETPQESRKEEETSKEETQAPTESEEKNTQEQGKSSITITEEKISEESFVDVIADGQQETTETTDETTEEQTPEEELKAMIEALPKLEDVDTTDEEQMESLLEQLNAIADFAEEHDIDVSENETLLALMELFQEPMMVDDQENGGYQQVTGTDGEALSADKAVTDFTFDSGINYGVKVSDVAVFVNGKEGAVNGINDSLTAGDSRTIKIPNGFKYYNGSTYDVYVKITSNSNLNNITWVCANKGRSYYEISPGKSDANTSFDYEFWLQQGDKVIEDIDLVAGSCYTASTEGVRPWSDNGKIYTNVDTDSLVQLKWHNNSEGVSNFWSPEDNESYNAQGGTIRYILGHGKTAESHVKGGYVRKESNTGAEMVLGYLVKTAKFVNEAGAEEKADALSLAEQKVATGKLVAPPTPSAKSGYYFAYWTADKAVTLSDDSTIDAGTHITQEQLKQVVATEDGFDGIIFTAHYADNRATAKVEGKSNLAYNGAGQELLTVSDVTGGTVHYSIDGGKTWSTDIPTGKAAGDYEVCYYVEPDEDHIGIGSAREPEKITASIAKKEITVSVTAEDKTYSGTTDAAVHVVDYGDIPAADKDNLAVSGLTGTFDNANVGDHKKVTVDSSNMVVSGNAAKNYQVTIPTETTANITKASQDAPATTGDLAVIPVAETIDGKNDGKLTNLTDKMEYRLKGTEIYVSVSEGATSVSELSDGTYEIRCKEDENHAASPAVDVVIEQGKGLIITVNPAAESGRQIGYSLITSEGMQSWHGGYKITFALAKGYKMTSDFAVMLNGEKINLTKNEDGTYTYDVTGMEEDHTVTQQGVSKNSKKHKHSSSQDESDTTVSPSSSATLTASPQTGDSNMPFFWSIMTMISAVILAGAGILFRRRKIK